MCHDPQQSPEPGCNRRPSQPQPTNATQAGSATTTSVGGNQSALLPDHAWHLSRLWDRTATAMSPTCRHQLAHQPRLLFTHIPKNGGTFIEEVGRADGLCLGKFFVYRHHHSPFQKNCSTQHVPFDFYRPRVTAPNVLCVKRDPYERLISEWKARVVLHGMKFERCPYNFEALKRHRTSMSPRQCALHFNRFVATIMPAYYRDVSVCDCHLIPQTAYIVGANTTGGRWSCNHVLEFRNLTDELRQFAHAGRAPRGSHVSHRRTHQGHRPNDSGRWCGSLTARSLSRANLKLVNEIYAEDFRILGYAPALLQGPYNGTGIAQVLGTL